MWGRWGRDFITFIAVALAVYSVYANSVETKERVDESCTISETKQKADVDALIATYRYLGELSGKELAQPLNKAVLAGLPTTVRNAQTDDAPSYCDEPDVGLPEPDDKVPEVPEDLKQYVPTKAAKAATPTP